MKKTYSFIFVICLLLISFKLNAQHAVIPLWKNGVPGEIKAKNYTEKTVYKDSEPQKASRVSQPNLSVYLPEKSNGTAVLILPGGGYGHLSLYKEGKQVAQLLNTLGITAFVLKYRLPNDTIMKEKAIGPLQDAQEAMRMIRRNAGKWKVDTNKVGVIGFSAGGHLAATLSNRFAERVYSVKDSINARPDFSILIYPVISMKNDIVHKGSQRNLLGENPADENIEKFSNENNVSFTTPPTYLVHAADDKSVPVAHTLLYFTALKLHKIPAEMHIYETGGHGFGLGNNAANKEWPAACREWLKTHGWVNQ